jgi:hypothetical protein
MRIETLNSLTEDELAMLLYILNEEPPLPIKEVTPGLILCYKDDILTFQVSRWGEKVKPEYKHIFDQLMYKMSNVKPRHNVENVPQPSEQISGSDQPSTGSI